MKASLLAGAVLSALSPLGALAASVPQARFQNFRYEGRWPVYRGLKPSRANT